MLEALVECVIKGHYISLLVVVTAVVHTESLVILLTTGGQKRLVLTAHCLCFQGFRPLPGFLCQNPSRRCQAVGSAWALPGEEAVEKDRLVHFATSQH